VSTRRRTLNIGGAPPLTRPQKIKKRVALSIDIEQMRLVELFRDGMRLFPRWVELSRRKREWSTEKELTDDDTS
jgi:hypothetical protein